MTAKELNIENCGESVGFDSNQKYNDIICKANDFLLYRRFQDCLEVCLTAIQEWRNYTENEIVAQAVEAMVALGIQAYVELKRWQEVLPFVTQVYNGLEDCPPLIAQLCLSLHARLNDHVTCTVVAGIWLKTPSNVKKSGYLSLIEMYIVRVLLASSKWEDVEPFLDSCHGLGDSERRAILHKVKMLRQKQQMLEADEVEVLERDIETSDEHLSSSKQIDSDKWTFFDFRKVAKTVVKYFPTTFLYIIRNICIAAVLLYFFITRWRSGKFSPALTRFWMLFVRFWKGMFAPFHELNR